MTDKKLEIDPERDLVLERIIDITPEQVWAAWTDPAHIVHWFTPAPWKTLSCEIDLQPGGRFHTVMQGPEGQQHNNTGCILEIVKHRKLVWTDALAPGYRPTEAPFMTAIIMLDTVPGGTKYTAIARHRDAAGMQQHASMGFQEGWGKALDQLVAHMKQHAKQPSP